MTPNPIRRDELHDMRMLSLCQPYTDLVLLLEKRFETRGRSLGARPGMVVGVHASLTSFSRTECADAWRIRDEASGGTQVDVGSVLCLVRVAATAVVDRLRGSATGGIVVTAGSISACEAALVGRADRERACGDWREGRHLTLFSDLVRLATPVPARGSLGLWRPEAKTLFAVMEQLPGEVR